MPSPRTRMLNTKKVKQQLLNEQADSILPAVLDTRLSAIGEGRRRDIVPAAGEMTSVMRQRDAVQELSKCRAEFAQLRELIEKRSNMLSSALNVIEQNGLTIPTGAKKFKRTMKKPMRMSMKKPMGMSMKKPMGMSMKKSMRRPKSRGKTRRNMSRRRRR